MLQTNIAFENAVATIDHYTTPFKKGKHKGKFPLEVNETGFTCYANNLKVLQDYAANGKLSVPSKAAKAEELLNKVEEMKQ